MTLTRLVLAWLPVAAWFVVAPPIGQRADPLSGGRYFVWSYSRWGVAGRLGEAIGLTLLASLWFDSLGSGGWWLVFLLVGLLAAYGGGRWRLLESVSDRKQALIVGLMDTARYIVAGAILAWRLR